MAKIWGKIYKNHKMQNDMVWETILSDHEAEQEAVEEICKKLDIPQPIWLNKQLSEMEQFGRTRFNSDNFMESITFDQFEVEYIREKGKSKDPRNDFSF